MTQNAVMRLTLKSECLKGETDVAILYPVKREEKRDFGSITEVKLQKERRSCRFFIYFTEMKETVRAGLPIPVWRCLQKNIPI